MLGSPLSTIEGEIDIITDTWRNIKNREKGKTDGIDIRVRHFDGFWEVLNSSWEENLVLKYWALSTQHLLYLSELQITILLRGPSRRSRRGVRLTVPYPPRLVTGVFGSIFFTLFFCVYNFRFLLFTHMLSSELSQYDCLISCLCGA